MLTRSRCSLRSSYRAVPSWRRHGLIESASCWSSRRRGAVPTPSTTSKLPSMMHCHRALTTSLDRTTIRGPHGRYQEEYDFSIQQPEAFWQRAAQDIFWYQPPSDILTPVDQHHHYRWFADGVTNMCYNCLDRHLPTRASQVALVYDSPVTMTQATYTYATLHDHVARLAGALQNLGVQAGDRVIIYMPMIPQAIITMLACCRIGAVHSVVFGGFAAKELATRITDCQPKIVVSASAGVEPSRVVPYQPLLDEALALADHNVEHVIMMRRENVDLSCELRGPYEIDFESLVQESAPIEAVPLAGSHPHSILYTSGTTGRPKGVVRDTAGWPVALQYSMGRFYDTNPGETFWAASDIGWIVGHAYIVYAPLLQGCTTVLYEGKPVGTPDAGAFWRVVQEYGVKTLFVAPTALRAIKQADPRADLVHQYDLSSLKAIFLAGEHSDPDTLHYCQRALSKYGETANAIDHWWQTELGWPGVGNAIGLGRMPTRYGTCAAPVPGYDARVVDDAGNNVPRNTLGNMVLKLPLPPGTLNTLYKDDQRYVNDYLTKYPGFYDTADAAFIDDDGYFHIVGRVDDIINTAGHRLSTGAMEEILMDHPDVADCAIFPVKDDVKGEVPVGLVVVNQGSRVDEAALQADLIQRVRDTIGPVASFKKVAVVKALPKTRSGKILRGTMAKIGNNVNYQISPTIEDPTIFNYLEPIIRDLVSR